MTDVSRIAMAINLRVRQLEAQGITGIALANHMIGHMQDLHDIYSAASDRTLRDLCDRFPGFERYARIMEDVSEQNQAMMASGSHPHGNLPELPEPLKTKPFMCCARPPNWSARHRRPSMVARAIRPSD